MTKMTAARTLAVIVLLLSQEAWSDGHLSEVEPICRFHDESARILVCSRTFFYDVEGDSLSQLKYILDSIGPKGYWAQTESTIYMDVDESNQCKLLVESNFTMPFLVAPERLSDGVMRQWTRMYKALETHELRHEQIAVEVANEIIEDNCNSAEEKIKNLEKLNKEYDRKTAHGFSEGVRF